MLLNHVKTFSDDEKLLLLAPIHLEDGRAMEDKLKVLNQQGYARIKVKDVIRIDDASSIKENIKDIFLVVDRIVVKHDEDF